MSSNRPTTREEFKDYCLRKLGWPVIEINVAPEQVEDRIDDALDMFFEYHFDGVEEDHLIITISDADISNNYITLDDKIFSVIKIYPLSNTTFGGGNIFSAEYQFYLNDFYSPTGGLNVGGLQYYTMMRQYLEDLQYQLNPVNSFKFNRKTNRIYFNETLSSIKQSADKLMFKVYKKLDISTVGLNSSTEVWDDIFLKKYATALIKKQWGGNLKKFGSVNLPGGVTLNGDAIYAEAEAEILDLETKLINDYQLPYDFTIG